MKRFVSTGILLLFVSPLFASHVTLPAVASVQGQALFRSDVRVFNASFTSAANVTATYFYCGSAGCGHSATETFSIPPRNAAAYNDIIGTLFGLPGTQGAMVFDDGASTNDLVVTSRLYSVGGNGGSYGQFVPGLQDSDAFPFSDLTSLQNNSGFRTDAVAFNPSTTDTVSVAFTLFNGDGAQLGHFTSTLGPQTFLPSGQLFAEAQSSTQTNNAYCVVSTNNGDPIFAAASVLDNISQDLIFIKGAQDQKPPAGNAPNASFNFSPASPTTGQSVSFTDTSTGNPTSWSWNFGDGSTSSSQNPAHSYAKSGSFTVTLTAADSSGSTTASQPITVSGQAGYALIEVKLSKFQFSPGSSTPIVLHVGQEYRLNLCALDNGAGGGHGFSGVPQIGLGAHSGIVSGNCVMSEIVTPTAGQVGSYPFSCTTVCGSGHSSMAGTLQVVNP